jgi:hypothetical protein
MVGAISSSTTAGLTAPSYVAPQSCGASPEARLLALMVYTQLVQGESAQSSIELNELELNDLRAAVKEAIEQAREANEDSGFWSDIGDVLGGDIASLAQIVAVAAACVATGGAAALVLGAIAIGCSLASKYADELGIPPQVAIGIGIAGAVAAVAAGNVGAVGGAASAASGASQVGTGAAQASKLTHAALQVKSAATLVGAGAQAGGAIANTASGYYAAEAVDHRATAQQAQAGTTLESMDIDEAIDQLEKAIDRQMAACGTAQEISAAKQQDNELVIASFAGAA